jgi:universal stress protein E
VALGSTMSLLRRILVATDFSPAGHAAVARAGQLALQYNCQLMVFHATPDWTLFSQRACAHQQHYADISANAEELMRGEVGWLGREYALTTVRGEVQRDRATLAITRAIETFQPDLLVIGAGGENPVPDGAPVLGGTALKLISRVNVPLLLVRQSTPGAYQSTLAAVAGELSAALRLTQWASSLAGTGPCHIVRVYDAPYLDRMRLCGLHETEIEASAAEQRGLALQDCAALERSVQPGKCLVVHIVRGAPVPTVLRQVTEYAPQLVVIGQHQHHSDEHAGAWAAGLGTRIAYHCPKDVLLVP